jgi:GTP-binding protein
MPKIPTVAIVGRPNTGKSTLFNRMVGERLAIESPIAGTTRDRVARRVETDDLDYLLVDTGGIGGGTTDHDLEDDVEAQARLAITSADLVLFTVDGRTSLTASDRIVAELLRKSRRRHVPVIVVATKCDNERQEEDAVAEVVDLGIGDDVIAVSGVHGNGIRELQERIVAHLTELHFGKEKAEEDAAIPRIALVGRPNVGKSSIINALLAPPQRATSGRIVSPIPGTTRDASDTLVRHESQSYIFVDTAGLKRTNRVEEGIEEYAHLRSLKAIEDCDIVILVLEAPQLTSHQDKRIAGLAADSGKGLIVLANKIDALKGAERDEKMEEAKLSLPFVRFAAFLPVSAQTRENLANIFPLIERVQRNRTRQISESDLDAWYRGVTQGSANKRAEVGVGLVQEPGTVPPTFILLARRPKAVTEQHLKFLERRLRESFAFEGTPMRFYSKTPAEFKKDSEKR